MLKIDIKKMNHLEKAKLLKMALLQEDFHVRNYEELLFMTKRITCYKYKKIVKLTKKDFSTSFY